jgi:hypothetical protein
VSLAHPTPNTSNSCADTEMRVVHLVVMQHGLWGKAVNMKFLEDMLRGRAEDDALPVVCGWLPTTALRMASCIAVYISVGSLYHRLLLVPEGQSVVVQEVGLVPLPRPRKVQGPQLTVHQ